MVLPDYPFASQFFSHPDQLRQHFLDEGRGAPVLMLHGNPSWSYYYRRLVSGLCSGYRCIVPDHIGMGFSDKPGDDRYSYRLERRVEDLERLMQFLIDERGLPATGHTLIVHDWGGMIGLAYACRHPQRIARLVILNTAAFPNPKQMALPWTLKLGRDSTLGAWLITRCNAFAAGAATWGVKRRLDPATRAAMLSPYDSPAHRISTLRFVQDIPLTPNDPGYALVEQTGKALAQFSALPAQIHWGRHDFVFDNAFLAEWQRQLPKAELTVYEDAGHYVLEDAHERIIPSVREFLDRTTLERAV
ncbi:MAG TPA: alpha/beta fold hydrolase [Pseudomonadota bacterium]|nr:alpha/beta fold hydrolase [Xanthomonadales bacterium]HQW82469.1 alpha/beta fold hydrolase [Pseudomonadota bacterium]